MNKNLYFNEQKNSVDLLYDDEDISIVSLDLFHVDNENECNRNKCNISMECAKKSLPTIFNKPIICKYNSDLREFVNDVSDHAYDQDEAFQMRIAGHIPSDSRVNFIKRKNGKTYLNAEAIIQKKYMPQLMDILKKNNGTLKVSIEIKAVGEQNEDGIFVIDNFVLQGVTILSPTVMEGIEGSNIKVLKFSQEEISSMNKRYLQFSKNNTNIIDEIKKVRNKGDDSMQISTRELESQIWKDLEKYKYHDGSWEGQKYYVEEIYTDERTIIVRDNETDKYYKMKYTIDNGDVTVNHDSKVEVKKQWHERPNDEKRFSIIFAKEEYGTGPEIKIDKSEKAVSDKAWGDVDKTELRHKVLNAKNYKTLVKAVYAKVEDGWEDAPSEKLKYPIMLIEGDTAVYARYGLASALAYAKAENETSVVDKVEKLYDTINIREKEGKMDKTLQNKLDKDNPELEKIRDDAEAIEDDAKEKDKAKAIKNEVIDKPEGEKLRDDVDADKDYWKKKYSELDAKFNELSEELKNSKEALKVYQDKEDKENMKSYLKKYRKCFADDEYNVMASKIDTCNKADFEMEVDEKVKRFVEDLCKDCDDEQDFSAEIKNSQGFMLNPTANKTTDSKSSKMTLDTIYDSYKK